MMVSKDVKHDSFAVDTFVDKALLHLKEKGIPVKRIIMWSDNRGTQYKCFIIINIFQVTYYKGLMSTIPYALCLMEIASVGLLAV